MQSERLPQLDGLRGVAILMVMLLHYAVALPVSLPHTPLSFLEHVLSYGWIGVDLFFVLSGFLIGGILIANKNRSVGNYFSTFYARRFFRIIPLYTVALLIGLASGRAAHMNAIPGPGDQIAWLWYLTFTQNIATAIYGAVPWFGQSWSLAVEEQFYLLIPLTIWLVSTERLVSVIGALIGAALALRCLLFSVGASGWAIYVLLPTRMDQLLIGVAVAWGVQAKSSILQPKLLSITAMVCALIVIIFIAFSWGWGSPIIAGGYSVIGIGCGCVVALAVTHRSGPLAKSLSFSPLCWFGSRAYFLYIFHSVIPSASHILVRKYTDNVGLLCVVSAISLFGAAELSWRFFEKPLIDFGHRFRYYDEQRRLILDPGNVATEAGLPHRTVSSHSASI